MASLTRRKCDTKDGIPNDMMVKYYSQRASAGLIITECSPISYDAQSFFGAGGIWNSAQVEGWKRVTNAVHEKGGVIFIQIWHSGRASVGLKAPSPLPIRRFDKKGQEVTSNIPIELTKDQIKEIVNDFRKGAINAKEAGFDGIELHGANGYLVDNFIRDGSNNRTDEYGGSAENRSRFCIEVLTELINVFGKGRVGLKLSPVGRFQYMFDSNPIETYKCLLSKVNDLGIAYVQMMEPTEAFAEVYHYPQGSDQISQVCKEFRSVYKGTIMTNNNYTPETAMAVIEKGYADMVSFGRLYMPNPDLVERIQNKWPFNEFKDENGEQGYSDYDFYKK
jgi:2,4-dienoyl-CoA reductase-like NADH-dependent reductase (Old Yellow Enzyme family)